MAAQVKLIKRRDFSSDISSLSLYDNEEGFSVAWDGWGPTIAGDDDLRVAEAMTLQVQGDNHDDLAGKLRALNDKIREIGWHKDSTERYGIWLRIQLEDETYAQQALITEAKGQLGSSVFNPSVSPGSYLHQYQLALERTPYWETPEHNPCAAGVYCRGAIGNYGPTYGAVVGDIPARIAQTSFTGSIGGPLYEFWMGFRTDRWGGRLSFEPIWDLGRTSDSTPYNSTTSINDTGGTVYGNYYWRCSFANEAMLKRVVATLGNVTSSLTAQRGKHLILLRAKVGSGTTCHVRLLDGFVNSDALRTQPRVTVSSTSWMLYPLGTVSIPPSRGIVTTAFLDQYGFEIQASRISGSGHLDIDYITPIPRSEGFIHVSGGAVQYAAGDGKPMVVRMFADGHSSGWAYQSNSPLMSITVEPENYALPVGDGVFVLAGQRATSHVLTDYVTVTMLMYPRWRVLRGSDAMPPIHGR